MRVIDRSLQVVDDTWTLLADDAELSGRDLIVSAARWQRDRELLQSHQGRLGLRINGDTQLETLAGDLQNFELVAIEFPKFVDGRGYSLARLLRERHHYQGELRAIGDVLRDQIDFMRRCGIDTFAVREDTDAHAALKAFSEFTVRYQSAADGAQPIYRRR